MLSIVIPAYNEEDRLPRALSEIAAWVKATGRRVELIVADDGSSDRTVDAALSIPMPCTRIVVPHPLNTGKGAALKRGVAVSSGDLVLTVDSDLPAPLSCISLLEAAIRQGADAAFGSRHAKGSVITRQQPFVRRIAGRAFNLMVRHLLSVNLKDTQCGFKLFRGNVARELFSQCIAHGFAVDAELAARARMAGYRVVEVGITWAHVDGGSVRLARHSLETFAELLRVSAALAQAEAAEECVR